ncbi:MAG: peptidylprolyl isomerase, partial [Candidatus Aminicenantes bacterium]|nr:peptidylprolyl isomerase [Candidatus Aminicenantes bacterium]
MKNFFLFILMAMLCWLGFSRAKDENPVALINTDFGTIKVEIFAEHAPITATNFLRYVDAGLFKGAS